MIKKRFDLLWLGLVVMIFAALFMLVTSQKQTMEFDSDDRLRGLVGNTLYKIQLHFNILQELRESSLSPEHVKKMSDELLIIEAYAETVDFALSPDRLLEPIIENMKKITIKLEESYTVNQGFTKEDEFLLDHMQSLIPFIHKVYYVPESVEGAKVTLNLNNKDMLIAFNDELNQYVTELSKWKQTD